MEFDFAENLKKNSFGMLLMQDINSGVYSPGEKLPSERTLCVKYGFSRPTVHKNLEELVRLGVLTRDSRQVYVSVTEQNDEKDTASRRIILLMNSDGYVNLTYRTMIEGIISRFGNTTAIRMFVTAGTNPRLPERFKETDVVVVFGLFLAPGLLKKISECSHNVIAINFNVNFANWLMPDNYLAGRLMGETLYQAGHRKITAVLNRDDYPEFEERFRGLSDYLGERDIALERPWIPACLDYRHISELYFNEFALTHKVTAFACMRYPMAMDLYDYAFDYNLEIPRDFSLVGFDDTHGCAFLSPAMTTVRYPVTELTEKLLQAIPQAFRRMRGEVFLQQRLQPLLIKRASVAAPGDSC